MEATVMKETGNALKGYLEKMKRSLGIISNDGENEGEHGNTRSLGIPWECIIPKDQWWMC